MCIRDSSEVVIDQTAADGWQTLGTFDFDEGGYQSIFLGDNTGELPTDNVQIVFDAVRLTRVAKESDGEAADDGSGSGDDDPSASGGGCAAASGHQLGLVLFALLAGLRRRRSR